MPKPKTPKRNLPVRTISDPSRAQPTEWLDYTQLEWFTTLDKPTQKQCTTLATLAEEVHIALTGALSVYTSLVKFVKTAQLPPNLIKATLEARGFNDSRISEIRRVAEGPDDLLEQLENRTIGFKQALRIARTIADNAKSPAVRLQKKINKAVVLFTKMAEAQDWTKHEEIDGPWKITIERIEPRVTAANPF